MHLHLTFASHLLFLLYEFLAFTKYFKASNIHISAVSSRIYLVLFLCLGKACKRLIKKKNGNAKKPKNKYTVFAQIFCAMYICTNPLHSHFLKQYSGREKYLEEL